MILEFVDHKDSVLTTPAIRFDFEKSLSDPIDIATNLAQTMISHKGLSISAPSCGLPYRIFLLNGQPIWACFNPIITEYSDESVILPESCVTHPGLHVKIKRPAVVRVRFFQPNGEVYNGILEGLTSRLFQHEMDHLDGIDYLTRATKFHLDQAKKSLNKKKASPK